MLRSEYWRHFDFWLLGAVILANAFGIAMIRSAIAGNETLAELVPRQIVFASLGMVVIIVVSVIDYRYWAALIRPIYLSVMVFLVALLTIGGERFGAARWVETGLVSIQPTELAKIVCILALAYFFDRSANSQHDLLWIAKSLLIAAGLALWIFLQPNLSNVIVIMVIWGVLIWVSGMRLRHLAIFSVIGIVLLLLGIFAPFSPLEDYQRQRVFTFLFPNPEARHGATYNVQQALIAIGSGGLFGKGYGHGSQTQLRFLKVRHTDFIFSAVAEEFGLVGAVFVIAILVFIIYRCLRTARLARDPFGSLIAYGVAFLIFFQTSVNIAVNLNLLPVSGLPLPFISYGGSGLLSVMLSVGLVESVVLRHKALEF